MLLAALLLARLPSLAQPAGADQSLYAYAGTRILEGGLPYRDAWDQKPPAIHFTYALLYGLWPHQSVVPAADLAAAGVVALMLVGLGRRLPGGRAAGITAAALFLFLGDPTLNRLAGVRVRAQCETFIALAITAAMLLAARHYLSTQSDGTGRRDAGGGRLAPSPLTAVGIGSLIGVAFALKYNAAAYAAAVLAVLTVSASSAGQIWRRAALVASGAAVPVVLILAIFAAGGALGDLYEATIQYNLFYSGETYDGPASFLRYLFTFPIQHARVDALWFAGGVGCLVLLAAWALDRSRWPLLLPVVWVAAACLSIAINGSRGLPQYFVQAAPALALSAGVAAARLWPATALPANARAAARAVVILLVAVGAWRVTDLDKIPQNAAHDVSYLAGWISRDEHLARYGGQRDEDKYSALAVQRLGEFLRRATVPGDYVYIFGFSPGAYLLAERVSPSRFFWSRPLVVGFNRDAPGYGSEGLLAELEARPPTHVVLQIYDWAPPPGDSASFFRNDPMLGSWLRARYHRAADLDGYEVWARIGSISSGVPPRDDSAAASFPPRRTRGAGNREEGGGRPAASGAHRGLATE